MSRLAVNGQASEQPSRLYRVWRYFLSARMRRSAPLANLTSTDNNRQIVYVLRIDTRNGAGYFLSSDNKKIAPGETPG